MTDRTYDVVVWGATGFTGSLVAEVLNSLDGVDGDLRWAIAGRSQSKLDELKARIHAPQLPTLLADSFDTQSLERLAESTRVVLTTVGPYAKYGDGLVTACVEAGTDYVDLTGEPQFIRKNIDLHHTRAKETGARIVHCCGFDSIPSELGVWFLQQEATERLGRPCESITMLVKGASGGFSGGTAASLMNIVAEAKDDRNLARMLSHPYTLNPKGERDGPDARDQRDVRYNSEQGTWTAPFMMAPINTRVVRRGHALMGYPWGRGFRYTEAIMTGDGISGRLKASAIAAGTGAIVVGGAFSLSRDLLERFLLPKPGEGPDAEARERGFFNLRFFGTHPDGQPLSVKVTGQGDPGYASTSKMIAQSAVCLAKDDVRADGGILTPASAMAEPLLARLRQHARMSFEVL